jgi:type IV secretion system protein VirB3
MLKADPLFVALTRPQMFAGVTYTFFVLNGIITTELFLLSKSIWVLAIAALIHLGGALVCLGEPRFFDLWLVKVSRCPRIRAFRYWRCNSYRA